MFVQTLLSLPIASIEEELFGFVAYHILLVI